MTQPSLSSVHRMLLELGAQWRSSVGMDDDPEDPEQWRRRHQECTEARRPHLALARTNEEEEEPMWVDELTNERIRRLVSEHLTGAERAELNAVIAQLGEAVSEALLRRPRCTLDQVTTLDAGGCVTEGLLLAGEIQQIRARFERELSRVLAVARRRYLDQALPGRADPRAATATG